VSGIIAEVLENGIDIISAPMLCDTNQPVEVSFSFFGKWNDCDKSIVIYDTDGQEKPMNLDGERIAIAAGTLHPGTVRICVHGYIDGEQVLYVEKEYDVFKILPKLENSMYARYRKGVKKYGE
jgi:hypothetical protein